MKFSWNICSALTSTNLLFLFMVSLPVFVIVFLTSSFGTILKFSFSLLDNKLIILLKLYKVGLYESHLFNEYKGYCANLCPRFSSTLNMFFHSLKNISLCPVKPKISRALSVEGLHVFCLVVNEEDIFE